jgi:spore coat protein U-like protein
MKNTLKAIVATTAVSTLGLFPLLSSAPAFAGSASTNFGVSASVGDSCTIGASNLDFGTYDPIVTNATTAKTGTSTVTITCTKGALAKIGLDKGVRSNRTMINGSSTLNYELYKSDAATGTTCTTTAWGNTAGTDTLDPAAAPSKAARDFKVCGQIAAGQDVPSGSYADTVAATVNF